jgi:hypothetical protein
MKGSEFSTSAKRMQISKSAWAVMHTKGDTAQRDAHFAQAQKYAEETHLPHFIAFVQNFMLSWLPHSESPL